MILFVFFISWLDGYKERSILVQILPLDGVYLSKLPIAQWMAPNNGGMVQSVAKTGKSLDKPVSSLL